MDGSDLRILLKEKDRILLRILELSAQYQDAKAGEQRHISAAHLHLASAKVVLGHQRLSSDSFDFRMQSQVPLSLLEDWSIASAEIKGFVKDQPSLSSSLRQRRKGDDAALPLKGSVTEKGPDVHTTATETVAEDKPRVDPLRWFGGLSPQSLRSAQKDFQQGASFCLYVHVYLHTYGNTYSLLEILIQPSSL